jgi:hypothetical protein
LIKGLLISWWRERERRHKDDDDDEGNPNKEKIPGSPIIKRNFFGKQSISFRIAIYLSILFKRQ